MTKASKRVLYWTPRTLSIAFIAFLSLFALDVFGPGQGFWKTLLALTMQQHQIVLLQALHPHKAHRRHRWRRIRRRYAVSHGVGVGV